jgi:hypothetical protein
MSRRAFLAATGGLVVAAACGGSSNGSQSSSSDTLHAVRVSSDQYASSTHQRLAFALTRDDRFFDGPEATIAFRSPSNVLGPRRPAVLRSDGLPEDRGIYSTEGPFEEAGVWFGEIEVDGRAVELPFTVNPLPETLIAGEPAHRAPSPTPANPLGVDPICTREPACGLHEVSLDQLGGSGRPVAVMFATPARCQTQYCGPVLDLLLDVKEPFEEVVDFVHVEIYADLTSSALVPTVDTWALPSEPWLFGIDAGGRVTERLGGAFDRSEISELVERLATSEPQGPPEGATS